MVKKYEEIFIGNPSQSYTERHLPSDTRESAPEGCKAELTCVDGYVHSRFQELTWPGVWQLSSSDTTL